MFDQLTFTELMQRFEQLSPPGMQGKSLMWPEEREAILNAIPVDRPCRVVEIGTYDGCTARWLGEHRPLATIVSVDNASAPEHTHLALENLRLRPNVRLFVGDSRQLAAVVPPGIWDVVVVDADHEYGPVLTDLEMAYVLCRPGGVVFAHDYGLGPYPGVQRAVDQACKLGLFRHTGTTHWLAHLEPLE
ncbi:MAG: class I SAM-dependent methyltransferase [Planctomycetota bacterium]